MVLLPRFSSPILLLLILLFASTGHVFGEKKSYIVFLGEHSHGPEITEQDIERVTNSHHEFLASFLGSKEKAKEAIFYSYTKHINGFAATLEEGHAESIAGSYVAHVRHIDGVKFSVEPETLTFKKIGEEKSFKLRVEITTGDLLHAKFGELLWTDGEHYVRSPLVIGHKVIVH